MIVKKARKGDYRYGNQPPYPAALTFMPSEELCVLKADEATIGKIKEAVKSSKSAK